MFGEGNDMDPVAGECIGVAQWGLHQIGLSDSALRVCLLLEAANAMCDTAAQCGGQRSHSTVSAGNGGADDDGRGRGLRGRFFAN